MPVHTACIHKACSVALVHSRTLRRCVVSRFAATRPHNGLTHTGGALRGLSKVAVGGVALPLTRGLNHA